MKSAVLLALISVALSATAQQFHVGSNATSVFSSNANANATSNSNATSAVAFAPEDSQPLAQQGSTPKWALEFLQLVNDARAERGLSTLCLNTKLMAAAVDQAQFWGDETIVVARAHTGPNGNQIGDRVRARGFQFTSVGENAASEDTPAGAFQRLMESPPHRQNILTPEYRFMGVGGSARTTQEKHAGNWFQVLGQARGESCIAGTDIGSKAKAKQPNTAVVAAAPPAAPPTSAKPPVAAAPLPQQAQRSLTAPPAANPNDTARIPDVPLFASSFQAKVQQVQQQQQIAQPLVPTYGTEPEFSPSVLPANPDISTNGANNTAVVPVPADAGVFSPSASTTTQPGTQPRMKMCRTRDANAVPPVANAVVNAAVVAPFVDGTTTCTSSVPVTIFPGETPIPQPANGFVNPAAIVASVSSTTCTSSVPVTIFPSVETLTPQPAIVGPVTSSTTCTSSVPVTIFPSATEVPNSANLVAPAVVIPVESPSGVLPSKMCRARVPAAASVVAAVTSQVPTAPTATQLCRSRDGAIQVISQVPNAPPSSSLAVPLPGETTFTTTLLETILSTPADTIAPTTTALLSVENRQVTIVDPVVNVVSTRVQLSASTMTLQPAIATTSI